MNGSGAYSSQTLSTPVLSIRITVNLGPFLD